jgi:xanthine dehydrogenase accessory factor
MSFVLVRGGGDLASGVALRLHEYGLPVIISELPMPVAVHRKGCFADAVYAGRTQVEDCVACRVDDPIENSSLVARIIAGGAIPVLVDPVGEAVELFHPKVVVDGRMLSRHLAPQPHPGQLLIGLGPGFVAGENCDVVVETTCGNPMGSVLSKGAAQCNTSESQTTDGRRDECVLRAPADGRVKTYAHIGDHIATGETIAEVDGHFVIATFNGILRGLIYPGMMVKKGMKIGDLDPRDDPRLCFHVSDESRVVAEGVLEAIQSKLDLQELKRQ